jgi:hypothetical protein
METTAEKKGLLVTAAKAVGHAAGSVVSMVSTRGHADVREDESSDGNLPPKHKHRLPRRLKKEVKSKEAQGVV